MGTCKNCINYLEYENKQSGGCALFGNKELIAANKAVFDENNIANIPLCDVGEDFGCIHFEKEFIV